MAFTLWLQIISKRFDSSIILRKKFILVKFIYLILIISVSLLDSYNVSLFYYNVSLFNSYNVIFVYVYSLLLYKYIHLSVPTNIYFIAISYIYVIKILFYVTLLVVLRKNSGRSKKKLVLYHNFIKIIG